jgi:bis(5'-nucleosidyl)-tetraphosphatase
MKEDKGYGVIVIFKGDENLFLLLKHQKGHWGFPKGHAEGDETPIQSATRELKEETGISDCEIKEEPVFFEEYTFNDDGILCHKIVQYFLGISTTQEVAIQEAEISEYRWVTYEEALNLFNYPAPKQLLTEVVEYLKSN